MLLNCGVGEDSCKEIQQVHPKGDQSWVFIGRTEVEAETSILWPPDVKSWLIWKDSDAGKDWRQEEKGMTGWDGWMASPTQWAGTLVDSGSWWWTGRPGVLQFMGSQSQTQLSDWTENWLNKEVKDLTLNTIRLWWKKLKTTQTNRKIYHCSRPQVLILLKYRNYQKNSPDSMQSLSKYQWHFSQKWE